MPATRSPETILIVSSSIDAETFNPVSKEIISLGHNVMCYLTDRVVSGEDTCSVALDETGISIFYNGTSISPESVKAGWYRKPHFYSVEAISSNPNDEQTNQSIKREVDAFNDMVWTLYPNDLWLNSPEYIRKAQSKLGQLTLARTIGFNVPDTVLGNSWDAIDKGLLVDTDLIVVKAVNGNLGGSTSSKAMYSSVISKNDVERLRYVTTPLPSIYQTYKTKRREWRVTAVGDKIFSAAIYTAEDAKDDWRKHQSTNAVTFVNEDIPDDIALRCSTYLRQMNLRYGAFDFIESDEGEITFLECNPNGQYRWLEDKLDMNISREIAIELTKAK